MDSDNPYSSPSAPNPFANPAPTDDMQARIEEEAKRIVSEKKDKTTSWQLLVTGIIGCFSPILAIYGIVFLLRRPYPFPLKGLAIAGTVLHCVWTGLLILQLVLVVAAAG